MNADDIRTRLQQGSSYRGSYELYEQDEFPSNCPWRFDKGTSASDIVNIIFHPIAGMLPKFVQMLTRDCRMVFALQAEGKWFLIYFQGDEGETFCGGQPTTAPQLEPEVLSEGWELPEALRLFYSVHNGFGPLFRLGAFWPYDSILPDGRVDTLSMLFATIPDVKLPYDARLLLHFYPDGAGNGQYFYRQPNETRGERTLDWDHETRELTNERDFWEFVDEKLLSSHV